MSTIFLKVKIKSLAEESRIIRREKNIAKRQRRSELVSRLHFHRIHTVRREARHSLLAYGYLRGRTYRSMEQTCHRDPNWEAVERMIKKYGQLKQPIKEWKDEQETENVRGVAA